MITRTLLAASILVLALQGIACDKVRQAASSGKNAFSLDWADDPAPSAETSPEAQAILTEMARVYSECEVYADDGQADSFIKFNDQDKHFISGQRFHSDFVRPLSLRVQQETTLSFGGIKTSNIVWAHGDDIRLLGEFAVEVPIARDDDGDEPAQTWHTLMAATLDTTEVPGLILPDKMPPKEAMPLACLRGLKGITVVADEAVEGVACAKLRGHIDEAAFRNHPNIPADLAPEDVKIAANVDLWIEKEKKLLRRVLRTVVIKSRRRNRAIGGNPFDISRIQLDTDRVFRPRINGPRDWHALEFAEPGTLGDMNAPIPQWIGGKFNPSKTDRAERRNEAERIIDRVVAKYTTCKSYRDTGSVELVPISRENRTPRKLRFKTAFKRPENFRVDVRIDTPETQSAEYVVWGNGKSVRTAGGHPFAANTWEQVREPIDLLEQQADIPLSPAVRLLFPGDLTQSLFELASDISLLGNQSIDGRNCYVLRGRDRFQYVFTVWIDKKDNTIRRIHGAGHGHGHTLPRWLTLTCKPVINKKISKKRLQAPEAS